MTADGSNPEQITCDEKSNWFAHTSPDNKWIDYIAYISEEKEKRLFCENVKLRLIDTSTYKAKDVTKVFYSGKGTLTYLPEVRKPKKIALIIIQGNNNHSIQNYFYAKR